MHQPRSQERAIINVQALAIATLVVVIPITISGFVSSRNMLAEAKAGNTTLASEESSYGTN